MARGWESKSVEDQMAAAEAAKAERQVRAKPQFSPHEREQNERRQSLVLSRSQILRRLKVAQNARYRTQLELALEHLEAQLRECE